MALILVRHTRPDIAANRRYGPLDVGLLDSFATEAHAVHRALLEVRRVVTSPLRRCRKLARFIAAKSGLPLRRDECLTEMDFGTPEGRANRSPSPSSRTWASSRRCVPRTATKRGAFRFRWTLAA